MIRVLIVDDLSVIHEILKNYLETETDLKIVGTATDGHSAIERVASLEPDVVLMDIEMPKMDGLTATKIIAERFDKTKVLILTAHDSDEYLYRALQAGAKGYLIKTTHQKELINAIRSAYEGYFYLETSLLEKYIYKILELQISLDELNSLKVIIKNQLEESETLSYNSFKKSKAIEKRLTRNESNFWGELSQVKIEQEKINSQIIKQLDLFQKDLSFFNKVFWTFVLFFSLISSLNFIETFR